VRLAELSKVITKGTTPTSIGFEFSNDGVRFLRVQNIEGGTVNYERDTLFIDESTHQALKRSQIQPGDILVSIAGTIGRSGVVPEDSPPLNCNQAVAIVRTNGGVFRPYLRNWLESPDAQRRMIGATVTGTISNLSLTQVGNLMIPVPSLPEQRRIAEVLDRADALRAKRRVALVQLDTLTQSIFLDLLREAGQSVATVSIEDGMDAIIDYRGKSPTKTAVGVPLVTARVVKGGELLEPNEFIAEEDYDSWMRRGIPNPGDVLFTTEAPLGEVAQLDGRKVALAQRLLVLRGKPSLLNNTFLKHALTAQEVKRQIDARATGSTVRGIRQRELRKVMIPVPPLPVQRDFARRVAAVEKLKAAHRVSLAELNALFAMLQDRAFRGEL
jgi:type I restriction enzyme S subunit